MLKSSVLLIALSVAVPAYSGFALGSNVPEGFEDLFELNESMVRLRNLDGTLTSPIPLLTSFNVLRLDAKNQIALIGVRKYLEDNGIDSNYRQQILEQLMLGVEDKGLCLGKLNECEIYPETFEMVHNYNDQELYLFVSPAVLALESSKHEQKYHSSKSKTNGLINSFDLYVSDYYKQDSIVSLNNETILGLPYGYLKTDFNANNSDSGSEIYEAAYHLDVDAYALKVGHFEFDPEMNSTDFLNNTARLGQNSISVGTSEKLLVGGQNSNKVLSFYVPASGSVQVFRDDRLIYQNNVAEGQNSISYNELPSGRYEAVVEVSNGGQVVNTQTYQVYNSKSDSLAEGDLDFVTTVGLFSGSHYDYADADIVDVEDDVYGKALANYQLTRSLQIGVGGLATGEGEMFTLGGAYSFLDLGLNTEAVYSQFASASHINANVGIPYLSLSYEVLDNEDGDPIASYMYGYADYSRLSLNSSYSFGRGQSLYGVYSLTKDKFVNQLARNSEEQQFVSVGYSTPAAFNSRVNVNIDYSEANDEASLNLLWTIPLSDTVEAITGLTSDNDGVNQFKTTVRRNDLIESDSFATSLEVSNTYDRQQDDMYQDALIATSGSTSYARMNASVNMSTNDVQGINAGLSSTQIITGDGIYITERASSAYTLVDVDDHQLSGQDFDEKGYFTLNKDGGSNSKFLVYDNETVIPLNSYSEYQAKFDSQSVDLYNSGDSQISVFSHPGTVAAISPKVSRVVSFVSAFNDLSETPISDIECRGEGCIEVNEMTDGVFRVTVLEGLNFELTSDENQCLLPYEFSSTNQMNFGQNYCLPTVEGNEIYLVNVGEQQLQAMFLGAYQSSSELKKAVNKLESFGYQVIQKSIGEFQAIYIARVSLDMDNMLARHKQEIAEFRLLAKRLYRANTISYPVASLK
ncbi:TcfC E-set like domain-containing protein [Vibrio lentus]|uniref:Pilus assembly protein E-set like domain-containing protein n=1 Tax=Vibrio lentus TaxID=136468 RepID=A0AB36XGJ2_9VIBR|nr:TcfC E-set like domain-containing protein [Vibrio lentus]PMI12091.1 hypothetical protein BCU51_25600 [Vibrio lentus]PMK41624.1 hypothetical protein BCT99_26015 [Vibrio lentus]